jgi:hypothetical protein
MICIALLFSDRKDKLCIGRYAQPLKGYICLSSGDRRKYKITGYK